MNKTYEIDSDKVNSIEDIKLIIKAFGFPFTFKEGRDEKYESIKHLLKEYQESAVFTQPKELKMIDLTKISEPFGQLDAETQERLREHERLGGEIESEVISFGGHNYFLSKSNTRPFLNLVIQRAKSNDIPASVDWSHINALYKHIRVEADESVHAFIEEPYFYEHSGWHSDGEYICIATIRDDCLFASFRRGNMPWSEILLDRKE